MMMSDEKVAAARRGYQCRTDGDLEGALKGFSAAIKFDPGDANIFFYRGLTYFDIGDYARAVADYGEVIRLNPDWPSGYIKRGYAYLGAEDFDRAIADFSHSIRLSPNLAPAYRNRGNAYEAKGEMALAQADFDEGVQDRAAALTGRGRYGDAHALPELVEKPRAKAEGIAQDHRGAQRHSQSVECRSSAPNMLAAVELRPHELRRRNQRRKARQQQQDHGQQVEARQAVHMFRIGLRVGGKSPTFHVTAETKTARHSSHAQGAA